MDLWPTLGLSVRRGLWSTRERHLELHVVALATLNFNQ